MYRLYSYKDVIDLVSMGSKKRLGYILAVTGVVAAAGATAFSFYLMKEFKDFDARSQKRYERSLEAVGLSPDKVIPPHCISCTNYDLNKDGIPDYKIRIPLLDGTYATRYILGYNAETDNSE